MIAILSLIIVLVTSLIIVRVATVALTLTGLSKDLARFQARSAFTGAGFTTGESEEVVSHPVRRRIIMILMLLGNAGIVTMVSTLVLSFTNVREEGGLSTSAVGRMMLLVAGLLVVLLLANSRAVERWMSKVIALALKRWTSLDARDYATLLHLSGNYAVSELYVEPDNWIANKTLTELRLNQEGVLILGISRKSGRYVGAPRGQTTIRAGDTLLCYGREETIAEIDKRGVGPVGGLSHVEAVAKQYELEKDQDQPEEEAAEGDADDEVGAATS